MGAWLFFRVFVAVSCVVAGSERRSGCGAWYAVGFRWCWVVPVLVEFTKAVRAIPVGRIQVALLSSVAASLGAAVLPPITWRTI